MEKILYSVLQVRLCQEHKNCEKDRNRKQQKLNDDATYMVSHKQSHMINNCWEYTWEI